MKDLSLNLIEIRNKLKSNNNLLKLLTNNDADVLEQDYRISEYSIDSIARDYILPYSFSPEAVEDVKSLLCISYAKVMRDRSNSSLKQYILSIKIYCHKNLLEMNDAIRSLAIAHEIDYEINQKYITSVGRVFFEDMREIENTNGHYYGYEMFYSIGDFN